MRLFRAAVLAVSIGLLAASCSSSTISQATDKTGVVTTSPGTVASTVASTIPASTVAITTTTSTAAAASTSAASTAVTSSSSTATTSETTATTPKTTASTTSTTSAPSGPVFATFSSQVDSCPTTVAPDASFSPPPQTAEITISWKVTGSFDMIYDAVDNVDGPNRSNLPATGSDTFTRDCGGNTHTYYVVAVSNGHKTVKSKVVTGN